MQAETACWKCSTAYAKDGIACPKCFAINANADFVLAQAQREQHAALQPANPAGDRVQGGEAEPLAVAVWWPNRSMPDYIDWIEGQPELLRKCGARVKLLYAAPTLQPEPALSNLALPAEGAYIIHYDDADRPIELFAEVGARDAALRRYEQISDAWSATLFVKIKANTIDGRRIPDAALSKGDDARLDDLLRSVLRAVRASNFPSTDERKAVEALRAYVATLTTHSASDLFLREYQAEIRELTARVESAEEKGYDDAVNEIQLGFAELLSALNLPAEEGDGMDAAPAWIISTVLKQIAEGLLPLNISRDDDDHSYKVATLTRPEPGMVSVPRESLDTDERVCFYEQEFYVLSNFSSFKLTWRGIEFDTSEAAYHWEKFPNLETVRDEILDAKSAHDAFKAAEAARPIRRSDWDAVKVDVMRNILRAKAQQHEYVRRKLLETGDRTLVENSWRDPFWGWGPDRNGLNMLGKLWMEVRAELQSTQPSAEAKPDPAPIVRCQAGRDGDCVDPRCPQDRDGEPEKSGRDCPLSDRDTEPQP